MRNVNLIVFVILLCSIASCKNETGDISIRKNGTVSEVNAEENNKADSKNSPGEKSGLPYITSKEVKLHIGDSLTVKGFIADVYLSDKVAYLNFENKFPKNLFSCAIFENKFLAFGDLAVYKNKTAEVTGKITTYKNKPQIILTSKDQIRIITE